MCIAIPGRVVAVEGERADVDMLGICRKVSTLIHPEVQAGEYVLINAGLIVEILDEDEATANLALLQELMALDDFAEGPPEMPEGEQT